MTTDDNKLDELVSAVMQGSRYQKLSPDLIRRIARQEMSRRKSLKEAVRTTRGKLHQTAGAYLGKKIPYEEMNNELQSLPYDLSDPQAHSFCKQTMQYHASTRERLPILHDFFKEALEPIAPVTSILDLGCGFTPLCLPWMPVCEDIQYYACDIYSDMIDFINSYFHHFQLNGKTGLCDLGSSIPEQSAQLGLLLKMIPCLEQTDKLISKQLLKNINTDHILISYPVRSLGGKAKGMRQHYSQHFKSLIADTNWRSVEFEFETEIAFLISK